MIRLCDRVIKTVRLVVLRVRDMLPTVDSAIASIAGRSGMEKRMIHKHSPRLPVRAAHPRRGKGENMIERIKERICIVIAWALPKRLAYWAAVRVCSYATVGEWSSQIVPELKAMDALKRWPQT